MSSPAGTGHAQAVGWPAFLTLQPSLGRNLCIGNGTPGAPYLPGFGRCGIPRISTGQSVSATSLGAWAIYTLHSLGVAVGALPHLPNPGRYGAPGVPLRGGSFDRKLLGVTCGL